MDNEALKEKINDIVSEEPVKWAEDAAWYEESGNWLDKSARIALKILRVLRDKNISQKKLAELIKVSPQYINKLVKGEENLTLETICRLETALQVKLVEIPGIESDAELHYVAEKHIDYADKSDNDKTEHKG
jgi:transcriptional regulator with XRE-family HTH domain